MTGSTGTLNRSAASSSRTSTSITWPVLATCRGERRSSPALERPRGARVLNFFTEGTIDAALDGLPPVGELAFRPDPDGRFAGLIDVFGDASFWAIWTPGHTPGSTAYLARTPRGPVLFTGDTSHTSWGWENDVEPGTFTFDHEKNRQSLAQLRALVKEHPRIDVRLGHQVLGEGSRPLPHRE